MGDLADRPVVFPTDRLLSNGKARRELRAELRKIDDRRNAVNVAMLWFWLVAIIGGSAWIDQWWAYLVAFVSPWCMDVASRPGSPGATWSTPTVRPFRRGQVRKSHSTGRVGHACDQRVTKCRLPDGCPTEPPDPHDRYGHRLRW